MSKPFFEVFPTLQLNDENRLMLEGVEVTKVTTNSNRDYIKVYLYSRHLIQKKQIYETERMLKEQLFGKSRVQVSIQEQYELSEQYTPENLMDEYYDSLLLELDQKSVVERSMLQSAEYEFTDGNILCLKLIDSIVAQGKKDDLSSYLTEVFQNRFQRPIEVRVLYEKPKESKLKYNEIKLRQEVDAILEQSAVVREEKEQKRREKEEKSEKKQKDQKAVVSGSSGASGGSGKGFGGFGKKEG